MKVLLLLPLLVFFRTNKPPENSSSVFQKDTTLIIHVLDGNTAEWPVEKFKTDEETKMSYAVDNDHQTLFLAIIIADQGIQMKIMQDGMNLYLDTKGKKRESRGIEFPLKMENLASVVNMKVFGFNNTEPFVQDIKSEGAANIAMTWDSGNVIHIEYNIPLKMLEETLADLNKKKISIGWKLKENEMPGNNTTPVRTTSTIVAVPAGSRPPANRNVGLDQKNTLPQPTTNKAQSVWTTHTILF
jgi:hypothetical protein